jgi:serine/threonine protein kinase/tetratricopeptide (TPR) repeat protein
MTVHDWERVKELVATALDLAPSERGGFLGSLDREDPSVKSQVLELVRSHEEAGGFLDHPLTIDSDFLDDLEVDQRFSPGETVCERFEIVRLIGKGGMGEVYEAWDRELDDHVALKTLRFEVSTHEVFTARFRKEIQLARKVTHRNVCRIFDSFKHQLGDTTFISVLSMELLHGRTLADYLAEKGRLTTGEAWPIAEQIVAGLKAVHEAGIIHRDLKPSNLVLIPDGFGFKVKITDFGIAGRLPEDPSQPPLTQASKMLGTPDYMAPEQFEGGQATIRSDIYALGLVLYEMVTGSKPFGGSPVWKRLREEAPPPKKVAPSLPDGWNKVIACCLERKPEYRFRDVEAVSKGLRGDTPVPRKPLVVRLQRRVRSSPWTVLSFFLVCVALSIMSFRYYRQSPLIPPGTKVLVTDIASNDAALSGVTTALKSQLAQSTHFEIEEDTKVVETLQQMNRKPDDTLDARTAREVAWRSGVPLVISGTLAFDRHYVLSMKVELIKHSPLFPARTWERDFSAKDTTELLTAVHDASSWIRTLAGESDADLAQQDRPVEDTTTSSWLALQRYTEAEAHPSSDGTDTALVILREALQADPDFAKAHMRIADILVSRKEYTEGFSEWQKALELIGKRHLTDRETLRIEGQYYEDTGDYREAEQKFREYTIHYPHDYLAWFFWGSILDSMDHREEALAAFQKALTLEPESTTIRAHMAMLQLVMAHYPEGQVLINEIDERGAHELAAWLSATYAFLNNNVPLAQALADRLISSSSDYWKSQGFFIKARFLAEMGRHTDAVTTLVEGIKFDHGHGRATDEADKHIALAYLAYRSNDKHSCREHALEALRLDNAPRQISDAGTFLGYIGDVKSLRRLRANLNAEPDFYRVRLAKARLNTELDIALGRRQEALDSVRTASALARPNEVLAYLPFAQLRLGRKTEARSSYEHVLENKARLLLYSDNNLPGVWGDASFDLLTNLSLPLNTKCSRIHQILTLRQTADSVMMNLQIRPLLAAYRPCNQDQLFTNPLH